MLVGAIVISPLSFVISAVARKRARQESTHLQKNPAPTLRQLLDSYLTSARAESNNAEIFLEKHCAQLSTAIFFRGRMRLSSNEISFAQICNKDTDPLPSRRRPYISD